MTLPLQSGNFFINGPSRSGKSTFCMKLISHRNEMFEDPPQEVFYFYASWNKSLDSITDPNVHLIKGVPTHLELQNIYEKPNHKLLCLDDLLLKITPSSVIYDLFFIKGNHQNISVLFITQLLFSQQLKHLSLNAHYFIFMRSVRNTSQISRLASQLGMNDRIKNAFAHILRDEEPYTYLLIDLNPKANSEYAVRSSIFPGEDTIVYKNN